jgi:hypothetical protein
MRDAEKFEIAGSLVSRASDRASCFRIPVHVVRHIHGSILTFGMPQTFCTELVETD